MENQAKTASLLGNPFVALLLAVAFGTAVGLLAGADFPEASYDGGPDAGAQVADDYSIDSPVPLDYRGAVRRTAAVECELGIK